ncbi:hypothetical protein GCM10010967_24310 [Dyadobacter beijingensis]|uniref:Uncharacterized protein n=1 Tax=Dyadobacter beijingensis TaxID=365489 RepID=A0ABQ2HUR7_9BACT|nr:hypothetical protein [Dyadobacter beijingensis]GGM90424.1 hypothetical protein GCM10010967_24310 [Dyadobacter beijingensis]
MSPRLLAFVVLLNYLWVAAAGFISRPEQVPYMVMVEKSYSEHARYEDRRYMRMDGLESLMEEVMETRCVNARDDSGHLQISITSAVDCHVPVEHLDPKTSFFFVVIGHVFPGCKESSHPEISCSIFSPPRHLATA